MQRMNSRYRSARRTNGNGNGNGNGKSTAKEERCCALSGWGGSHALGSAGWELQHRDEIRCISSSAASFFLCC
jgi:hypothetical protein